jgi:hypothetical protein
MTLAQLQAIQAKRRAKQQAAQLNALVTADRIIALLLNVSLPVVTKARRA